MLRFQKETGSVLGIRPPSLLCQVGACKTYGRLLKTVLKTRSELVEPQVAICELLRVYWSVGCYVSSFPRDTERPEHSGCFDRTLTV